MNEAGFKACDNLYTKLRTKREKERHKTSSGKRKKDQGLQELNMHQIPNEVSGKVDEIKERWKFFHRLYENLVRGIELKDTPLKWL